MPISKLQTLKSARERGSVTLYYEEKSPLQSLQDTKRRNIIERYSKICWVEEKSVFSIFSVALLVHGILTLSHPDIKRIRLPFKGNQISLELIKLNGYFVNRRIKAFFINTSKHLQKCWHFQLIARRDNKV